MAGGLGRAERQRDGGGHAIDGTGALRRRAQRAVDAVLALCDRAVGARRRRQGDADRSRRGLARRRLAHPAPRRQLGSGADPVLLGEPEDAGDQHRRAVVLHLSGGDLAARPPLFAQSIRPLAVACILVILLGAGLITASGLQGGTIDPRGLFWAIPSPLVYAFYLAINSRLLRHYPPLVGASGLFGGMAVTFGFIVLLLGLDLPTTMANWAVLVFIGIGPGALTMSLFAFSVPRLGASGFAILANAELVTVVLIGVLVLGEAVTPGRAIGAVLIVTGILTYGLSRRAGERAPVHPPAPQRAGAA